MLWNGSGGGTLLLGERSAPMRACLMRKTPFIGE